MTMEEKKIEAIKRMKILEIHGNAINEFRNEGKLNMSETMGALYWLDDETEKQIRDWEKETGNLAYHLIKTFTEFGTLISILYISKYTEEWEMEVEDIRDGYVFSYVMNLDEPMFSEYGSIAVKKSFGGLVRIG